MPPIFAAHLAMVLKVVLAFVASAASIKAGVTLMNSSTDYFGGSAKTTFAPPQNSPAVVWRPNYGSGSCRTCLSLNSENTQIDVQQLLNNKPTPTLPLKISFAATSNMHLKATPTPTTTSEIKSPPASSTTGPVSFAFSNILTPPAGPLNFTTVRTWLQKLFYHVADSVYAPSTLVSPVKDDRSWTDIWAITWRIIWSVHAPATAVFLLPRFGSWKSNWTKTKNLGTGPSFKGKLKFAFHFFKRLTVILFGILRNPTTLSPVILKILVDFFGGEEKMRQDWQTSEKQRLADIFNDRNKETLAKERAEINQIANRKFNRLEKAHRDELDAAYERGAFATANIEPSFGPSLQNAETELRGRINGKVMEEGMREEVVKIFKKMLFSFIYALAVEESKPEGANTRYLSVIDAQKNIIESLRLLQEYREEAFKENGDLIKLLCRPSDGVKRIILEDRRQNPSRDPGVERFLASPLDGPAALSMMVNVSSMPFNNRLDTILDSDPYWKRFLASIARKESEQEARLASNRRNSNKDRKREKRNIKHASELDTHDVSQRNDAVHPEKKEIKRKAGIKDASEENHHDVATCDDDTHSNNGEVDETSSTKDSHPKNSSLPPSSLPKDVESRPGKSSLPPSSLPKGVKSHPEKFNLPPSSLPKDVESAEQENCPLEDIFDDPSWLKWQVVYLSRGYGTPEDPYAKPFSDVTPTTIPEETGDAAIVRQLHEEELALWREDRIEYFEWKLTLLGAKIAGRSIGNATSDDSAIDKITQAQTITPTDTTLPQLHEAEAGVGNDIANDESHDPQLIPQNDRVRSPDGGNIEEKKSNKGVIAQNDHDVPPIEDLSSASKTNEPPIRGTEHDEGNSYIKYLQQQPGASSAFKSDFNWHPKQASHQESSIKDPENPTSKPDAPLPPAGVAKKPNAPQTAVAETDEQTTTHPLTPTQKRAAKRKRAKAKAKEAQGS